MHASVLIGSRSSARAGRRRPGYQGGTTPAWSVIDSAPSPKNFPSPAPSPKPNPKPTAKVISSFPWRHLTGTGPQLVAYRLASPQPVVVSLRNHKTHTSPSAGRQVGAHPTG